MLACVSLGINTVVSGNDNLRVLPDTIDGVKPNDMTKQYLMRQVQQSLENWKKHYEQLKTPQQIVEYQTELRGKFIEAIGGFPPRTPLNPQLTGIVHRTGYRVEKIIFESQPKHYVTAALFLPDSDRFKPPYPAVLQPVGHSFEAKAGKGYQMIAVLSALNGIAVFVFDPIEQGERGQLLSKWPQLWGTTAHTMIAVGSILLGRNTARFEIWDGMRAIDYLQSRPDIDLNRIGCMGLSGGGTQTSYLMALDDRIKAASPACYITGFERLLSTIGPQDAEQNIYGQLAFGMDHANYLTMFAPTPILICATTQDFFDINGVWSSFRYAKRLYSRLGFSERIELIEHDGDHGYHQPLREATVRWMMRWLLDKDQPITEPNIVLLTEKEIQCTPQGQVMLLEEARSTYDLNRDFEKELAAQRRKLWTTKERADLLARVRKLAGIRTLAELPEPKVEKVGVIDRTAYSIEKLIFRPEEGVLLPALLFTPKSMKSGTSVLYLNEKGKSADANEGGPIEKLVIAGSVVLAVDLRGTGETQQSNQAYFTPQFGPDGQDFYFVYLLGRSYVGMRAEDILLCARFLKQTHPAKMDLVAIGHLGVPALHAAALEPDMFASVKLVRSLVSWSNVIELGLSNNQLTNTVHAALTTYDLPDLAAALSPKLTIEQPLNALGEPLKIE